MHATSDHPIGALMEVFSVGCATVHRVLDRARPEAAGAVVILACGTDAFGSGCHACCFESASEVDDDRRWEFRFRALSGLVLARSTGVRETRQARIPAEGQVPHVALPVVLCLVFLVFQR
jgi:hypothetical protein